MTQSSEQINTGCPSCEGTSIVQLGCPEVGAKDAWIEYLCKDCNAEWTENFSYTGYTINEED